MIDSAPVNSPLDSGWCELMSVVQTLEIGVYPNGVNLTEQVNLESGVVETIDSVINPRPWCKHQRVVVIYLFICLLVDLYSVKWCIQQISHCLGSHHGTRFVGFTILILIFFVFSLRLRALAIFTGPTHSRHTYVCRRIKIVFRQCLSFMCSY